MRYYLIAGERSGDLHAANLVKAMLRLNPAAEFRGMGGDQMQSTGVKLDVHYKGLAVMGIIQVIMNLRRVSRTLSQCKASIQSFQPHGVILIDYGGFNMRMAKWCKENGFRVFYYISPKVWAWNTGRALKLKATVNRMLCILPFEPEFFDRFDWKVDYVGNPVLDAVKSFKPDDQFKSRNNIQEPAVALLPGSRKGELKRVIPLMAEVARRFPELRFVVAAIRELPQDLYLPLRVLSNIKFVYEETYDLLSVATAAVVTSGTATLETALFKVPQVVVYKASSIEYAIAKRVLSVEFISLVNLIAGHTVVCELLQDRATIDSVSHELQQILESGNHRDEILKGYDEVLNKLDTGSASENAAGIISADSN